MVGNEVAVVASRTAERVGGNGDSGGDRYNMKRIVAVVASVGAAVGRFDDGCGGGN